MSVMNNMNYHVMSTEKSKKSLGTDQFSTFEQSANF